MTQSSFYADGETYDTAVVTSNDVPASTVPSQAPSGFYPGGTDYTSLQSADAVLVALNAAVAAAQVAQAAAEAAKAASDTDAAAAHQAYLDTVAMVGTALLKAQNFADLTNVAQAKLNLSLVKGDVGLGNVDNTSDANKPVSTAQAAADALKANIASPTLTGTPAAPTAAPGTNTTQLATTAFVEAARVILAAADALKAPLASPALTGTPTAPTATAGTNTTQLATTAFVEAARVILAAATALKADTASPTLTGTPAAPTAAPGTNTTQLATTAFTTAAVAAEASARSSADALLAPLASPALTGTPTAPTPTVGDNTTKIATTAFVLANSSGGAVSVRYDIAQGLTAAQQTQARANIGVEKKNYVINGAMMVSQENGSTVLTVANGYPVDQFSATFVHGGACSFQQAASQTPGGSPNRFRYTVTTADASVASTDRVNIYTKLEGLRFADLMFGSSTAKTFTLQFGCRGPAGTYSIAFNNAAFSRTYVAEYTIAAGEANVDVVKSVTVPGDTIGTWAKDNTVGINIHWSLMCGSGAVAGSWGASGALGSTNQFNLMGTAGNVFELFDVGLYEGAVAPAFIVPDFQRELAACQRYFWRRTLTATSEVLCVMQAFNASGTNGKVADLPVEMRAIPTASVSSPSHFATQTSAGGIGGAYTACPMAQSNTKQLSSWSGWTGTTGLTGGAAVVIFASSTPSWVQADARL